MKEEEGDEEREFEKLCEEDLNLLQSLQKEYLTVHMETCVYMPCLVMSCSAAP